MSGEVLVVQTPVAQLVISPLAGPQSALLAVQQVATLELVVGQGPAGPPSTGVVLTASGNLGGHKVVRASGVGGAALASSSNLAHLGFIIGVTTNAALNGDQVGVVAGGEIVEPSWTFTPGPLYLGDNGALLQAPPVSGFLQQIAIATAPTRIVVSLGPPIRLN
jgi:hypothetical protein